MINKRPRSKLRGMDPCAQKLEPWLDLVAVRGEVVVTLGAGEERREERIPEQLRRFL